MFGIPTLALLTLFGQLRAEILLLIEIGIAAAVVVHILLNKRDIGAAIGWIGLACLSPLVGGVLYFAFGINRVRRRARRLRDDRQKPLAALPPAEIFIRDDHLAPLERAARRISERAALPGNSLVPLHDGDAAYPAMLAAIAAAKQSIALSSYIFRHDAAGRRFVDALIAASQRGVAVRVLIDGIGGGYFYSGVLRRLRRHQVPAARFMHTLLPWRMAFLNLRSHKKILLVDGRIGFAGGMNIGAENLVATRPPHPVRDTHFRIDGPAVAQLAEAFAAEWSFVTDEELQGEAWFPSLAECGPAVARVITSGPDEDEEKIEFIIHEAIVCARRSIRVITPYFLPDERMVTSLALAATRGVEVDVVVPQDSDHPVVDIAMRANLGPLLTTGCRIWRNPAPFDHSKLMVVDGEWCLIGSANWDVRSFRLNFELCVEVYDAALASGLEALIQQRKGSRITAEDLAARRLPIRIRDAAVRLMLPYL